MEENNKKQKAIYDSEQEVKWGGFLNEFLWICAGVDRKVLRQCPTDYAKYAGIGGTILFTALMAMLSGGYALYTVFNNQNLSIGFGIFWGLLIFNLDRFIVNTMYSDGKVTISLFEFFAGLPRIIMAIFLGIVISTPLELKIYEKSINIEIKSMKKEKSHELKADDEAKLLDLEDKKDQIEKREIVDVSAGSAATLYNENSHKLDSLHTIYKQCDDEISRLITRRRRLSQYDDSIQYRQLSWQINTKKKRLDGINKDIRKLTAQRAANDSTYQKAIEAMQKRKRDELEKLDKEISEIKENIAKADSAHQIELSELYDGFQGRMEAFERLKNPSNWPKYKWYQFGEYPSTKLAAFFIALLFIIIETAPTFFKMMIASGPYDDLLRAEMHRVRVLSDKRISDINDEVNSSIVISVEKNKERVQAELLANKRIMDQIAKEQAEILEIAMEEWKQQELIKVKANPSEYIKSNTPHKNT